MATRTWLSVAAAVAQVEQITVTGPIVIGETFTVTINGKSITFTATVATVANVVAGLVALLNASTIPEFAEITWADASPVITGTGDTAGLPFICTVSETSAAGTIGTATGTAATGPNHWDNAQNWSGATVPVTGDTANIDLAFGSIVNGLDQSAVTLASLSIFSSSFTTNQVGRSKTNTNGYNEYREDYLKIGATICRSDAQSQRIKLNFGTVQTACEVSRTGSGAESGVPAVLLKGTHASNAFEIKSGQAGLAYHQSETATALTLQVGQTANVLCGAGCTLGTITALGAVDIQSNTTALTQTGGTSRVSGTATVGTLTIDGVGAKVQYESSGTVTTAAIGPGEVDCSNDLSARTFTNTTINAGGVIRDPRRTITHTNAVARGTNVSSLTAA